ncbi:hypothetical protein ACG02S_00995 [Roseateles sp. DC23W]|uniref:Uncharacterized protein n=1 Tax=Pelomonas dachongensis TaxID=3299029 RepID=A0ABW7EG78_9BURK
MKLAEFVSSAGNKVELVVKLAVILICLGSLIGLPLLMVYRLVRPLFGPDPIGHLTRVGGGVAMMAAFVIVWGALILAGFWLFEKSRLFRRVLGFLVVAVLLAGVVRQCTEGGGLSCVPSRYVEC